MLSFKFSFLGALKRSLGLGLLFKGILISVGLKSLFSKELGVGFMRLILRLITGEGEL
jgi:hypothetical protein